MALLNTWNNWWNHNDRGALRLAWGVGWRLTLIILLYLNRDIPLSQFRYWGGE